MPAVINGATALVGVLGNPVRHSLSPAMHNAALAELGLNWVYLALPASAERLEAVLDGLEAIGCRGLNVTIPHKQAVVSLAADLSPLALRLGAVNTLVPRAGGGWLGTNTDVEGFLAPLRNGAFGPWTGKRAVVLGCGGSALAVVAGLVELGVDTIQVAGRQPDALEAFLATCAGWSEASSLQGLAWGGPPGPGPDGAGSSLASAQGHQGNALVEALAGADLVVNTTPVGMASSADPAAGQRCPLGGHELAALPPQALVYDLIYTPRPSQLLRQAAARGCQSLDGLEMLVQQGAAALRHWSGLSEIPVDAMRQAALAELARG
ncbi:MAG: shikimate dehydrogenase [Cyanobacteria bacterium]|nr:shikimate dehydrogenase [Cyanobacteriota bacterium]